MGKMQTVRETGTWSPSPWHREEQRLMVQAILFPTLIIWALTSVLCFVVFYFTAWWENGGPVPLW